MAVITVPRGVEGLILAGRDKTARQDIEDIAGQLRTFFAYDGPIIAFDGDETEAHVYTNARLLTTINSPIVVTSTWLAIHTQDSRFSWSIDDNRNSIEVYCIPGVCLVNYREDGVLTSVAGFMHGAK